MLPLVSAQIVTTSPANSQGPSQGQGQILMTLFFICVSPAPTSLFFFHNRYVASLTAVQGATVVAVSLIARIEGTGMRTAFGQVPLTNISDSLCLLPNTTFEASLREFGLRDPPGPDIVPR